MDVTEMDIVDMVINQGWKAVGTVMAVIILGQLYERRKDVGDKMVDILAAIGQNAREAAVYRTKRIRNTISSNVSGIYTHMYGLAEYAPLRVTVNRYEFIQRKKLKKPTKGPTKTEDEGQLFLCYVSHEAPLNGKPIRYDWQGIEVDHQHRQHVIECMMKDSEGLFISQVEEMEDGDYKHALMADDVRMVYMLHLASDSHTVWLLSVSFNREPPLSPEEMSKIKLCAKNVKKLMFE